MGCTEQRNTTVEEDSIQIAQRALNFHINQIKLIQASLLQNSFQDIVTEYQLGKMGLQLNLNTRNFGSNTRIINMYHSLKSINQDYCLHDILSLGVLLSRGNSSSKSKILFDFYTKDKQTLDIRYIKNTVLQKLCTVATQTLSILVTDQQSPSSNRMKTVNFIQQITSVEVICINRVAQKMAIEMTDINCKTFVNVMSRFRGGALLTASGWRMYLLQVFNSNPPKKNWTNPYSKPEMESFNPQSL